MRVYAIGKTPPACCAVKNQKKRENINFNGFKMQQCYISQKLSGLISQIIQL